jgi:isopentenyl-diphosphate delta-isomerase
MSIKTRKTDHIKISLRRDVSSKIQSGFERMRFLHQALPEISLADVDTHAELWGKRLTIPLLISSMTGGTNQAERINKNLAIAAQETGIGLALGSMRIALERPELARTFKVRMVAPDILLFANLGAVQLNKGYTVEHCKRLVGLVEADGLILHLNPLHEALQPDGDTDFRGLLKKIEHICKGLDTPVIVKEVGWGISEKAARLLISAGVKAIDVGGAGGTSWSQVEMFRQRNDSGRRVASAFGNWGIPTVDSLRMAKRAASKIILIASGGLANGIDLAKSIAVGATMGGMAIKFLKPASKSSQDVVEEIKVIEQQLRITMFASGVKDLKQLSGIELIYANDEK